MTDFDRRPGDTPTDATTRERDGTAAIAATEERPDSRSVEMDERAEPRQARSAELDHEPRASAEPAEAAQPPSDRADTQAPAPLFGSDAIGDYRSRWDEVQTAFVDDPRSAVKGADGLVAEVMKDLARTFANERAGLEDQWSEGRDVSTEDLRIALQRYRSFFARLLTL
jgi:hypothetical protein